MADHSKGYQAEVNYLGEAQFPQVYGPAVTFKPQPSYNSQPTHQPAPSYQPLPVEEPQPSYQPQPEHEPQPVVMDVHMPVHMPVAVIMMMVSATLSFPTNMYAPAPVHKGGMPYEFAYAVKDQYNGNDFSHKEDSDGNNVLGTYSVQLPDGRKQTPTHQPAPSYQPLPVEEPQPSYQPQPEHEPQPVVMDVHMPVHMPVQMPLSMYQ
ncbi:proline-rich 33 kDa extensin-related protein-like [Penaeus japonicus]|uniref:proline-rich 33 kDa extensin-related protein-like n=1 Tax=Penaeus japonicus TaxID=27405 RepID=UPI001C711E47|nr:proline-rich 33 kDa extensin-related protein-like [Penaeus japonicus]